MLSFFRRKGNYRSSPQPAGMVPCPHCGSDVRETASACRHCGYDLEADPDEGAGEGYAEDDFDYDAFIDEEFGSEEFGRRQTSSSLKGWQRAIAVLLVIAFVLSLLAPVLF